MNDQHQDDDANARQENKTHKGSLALARYLRPEGAKDYASKFERSMTRRRTNQREHQIAQMFLKTIDQPGASLLNIPCGAGRFVESLAPHKRVDVVFADFSNVMLEQAGQKIESLGMGPITFREMDATKDVIEQQYGLVFCIRLLHHMKTDELEDRALRFLAAASSDWLIFSCATNSTFKGWSRSWRNRLGLRKQGERIANLKVVCHKLQNLGLEIQDIQYVQRLFSSQTWLLAKRKPS